MVKNNMENKEQQIWKKNGKATSTNYIFKSDTPNTLGTTMEERESALISLFAVHQTKDPDDIVRNVMKSILNTYTERVLSQSKTDLLNALIDREESKKYKSQKDQFGFDPLEDSPLYATERDFNKSKDDTINHLKSLRDIA